MAPRLTTGAATTPTGSRPGHGRPLHDIPAGFRGATASSAGLTNGDVAVLALLADGHTQHAVARRLDMSARTVRRRLCAICAQLQVREPIEAVVWAAKRELL